MFLLFLLVTVQLSIHLFALSRTSAMALDAATRVARDAGWDCDDAVTWLQDRFGEWAASAAVSCSGDDDTSDVVRVRVAGPSPALLVHGLGAAVGVDSISRDAVVRNEYVR